MQSSSSNVELNKVLLLTKMSEHRHRETEARQEESRVSEIPDPAISITQKHNFQALPLGSHLYSYMGLEIDPAAVSPDCFPG